VADNSHADSSKNLTTSILHRRAGLRNTAQKFLNIIMGSSNVQIKQTLPQSLASPPKSTKNNNKKC